MLLPRVTPMRRRPTARQSARRVLAALCLALLSVQLHALRGTFKMCELVCAETPGRRWILPCFMASSNVRVSTGHCAVTKMAM